MSKINYKDVKQSIEGAGWTLISKEYVNLKTGLELLCPNGHQINLTYEEWRKDTKHECPLCIKQPIKKINEKSPRKKGQRILALDQSTHISGWSVYEDDKLLNYGEWTAPGNNSTERIYEIKNWVIYMVKKFSIDFLILEDIQLQKFSSEQGGEFAAVLTFKTLAHLQGVLENLCYEKGIPYIIISPATWKSYNHIRGKTRTDQKKSAQLRVQEIYDIKVDTDTSDAILIGRWASKQLKQEIVEF